jgi:hypothetical protein
MWIFHAKSQSCLTSEALVDPQKWVRKTDKVDFVMGDNGSPNGQ